MGDVFLLAIDDNQQLIWCISTQIDGGVQMLIMINGHILVLARIELKQAILLTELLRYQFHIVKERKGFYL